MCLLLTLTIKQISLVILCNHSYDYTLISITFINGLVIIDFSLFRGINLW